jgi:predicted GNAT family acetyltransferase
MEDIKLELNEKGHGAFLVMDGEERLGEMVVSVSGKKLTVYHTEVATKAEGRGLAKKMLTGMVDYARKNDLKVIPLCPYVHAQFKRHPDDFADIWSRDNEKEEQTS